MSSSPEVQSLVTTNLATVCVESALTGVFWALYAGSTYLLVQRNRMQAAQATGISSRSFYKSPMFIASNIILVTVTAVSCSRAIAMSTLVTHGPAVSIGVSRSPDSFVPSLRTKMVRNHCSSLRIYGNRPKSPKLPASWSRCWHPMP